MRIQLPKMIRTESIEWFVENQAFSPSYDLAPTPAPLSSARVLAIPVFLCVAAGRAYWRERGGGNGVGGSLIKRRRRRLVLCKSFNTLWNRSTTPNNEKRGNSSPGATFVVENPVNLSSARQQCQADRLDSINDIALVCHSKINDSMSTNLNESI